MDERLGERTLQNAAGESLRAPRRLCVLTPAQDRVEYEFAASLARATAYYAAGASATGDRLQLFHEHGAHLVQQRNRLVEAALEVDATHVIFVDSDSAFPKDAFDRLMAHNLPVVGVNFSTRRPPFRGVAAYEHPKGSHRLIPVPINPNLTGLFEADVTGTGMVCIETEVFRRIEKPWFDVQYIAETEGFWSEDAVFSLKVREAGIPIYIDLDLSREVAHIGKRAYTLDEAWASRPKTEKIGGPDEL